MEGLINIQIDLYNSIKKGLNNFKKSPKERITKEYVEARLENLEKDWTLFKLNNSKLHEISKPSELATTMYVTKEIYDTTEENYLVYKSLMKVSLNQIIAACQSESSSSKTNGNLSNSLVRLPKIIIPTFSGNYSEWTTFRDLFISLVHKNDALQNVQKLHYLKSHLTGEAEQLIRQTPITDANYSQCWHLLEKRYNNKKYLANCILKRLFGQRRMNVESSTGLKELLDATMDCLNGLKNLDIDVGTWDIIIIHIITFKLDCETRKQWELNISSNDTNDLPSLDQFKKFIESRFRALEFVDVKKPQFQYNSNCHINKPKALLSTNFSGMRCEFCSENHKLCFCKKFSKQSCAQRRDFVAKNAICFNCLGGNHTVYDCKKPTTCRVCGKRHHSLLHPEEVNSSRSKEPIESTSSSSSTPQIVSCLSTRKVTRPGQVLLATALVNIESQPSGSQVVRALLDQGSQACFITESVVQLLQLKKESVRGTITGLGGEKPLTSKYTVTVQMHSRVDKAVKIKFKAYVLKNITTYLPEQRVQFIDTIDLEQLCLADPQFNIPNKIDILLGANVFSQILKDGIKKSSSGALIAQNTSLGWILSGTVYDGHESSEFSSTISVMHAHINDDNILKQFWEIEEKPYSTKHLFTEEEQKCETIFKNTTKRTSDGRYVVKLPFRDSDPGCLGGDSRRIAVAKFKALEKRLSKDLKLKKSYTDVINEYLLLGHMRLVDENDTNQNTAVYLPHHAVVREDKATTKVRVVFNASSKNNNGLSLNDTLLIGPKLQPDLRHLVWQWRIFPIVLIADIIKMYRQVQIAEEDTIFQRIVWRDDPEKEIKDYELMTVTFGTASAPYLAVKAMHQVGVDEGEHFPLASSRVDQSFYMDDLMTGCSEFTEGIEIYKQFTGLLAKGGFTLQKWNSNNQKLLAAIRQYENLEHLQGQINEKYKTEKKENTEVNYSKDIEIKAESTTKILGITWDRDEDYFQYSVNLPIAPAGPETKRTIISAIARLYDPLGWIAPSIIIAKMFIQKLWLAGITWDEPISAELYKEWDTYRKELHSLAAVKVPRWLGIENTVNNKCELHGFCDASKLAYAAVIYLRVVGSSGERRVSLLTAKTRVAPIKQVSIPRLELCGAVLLTRLLTEVAQVLHIPQENIKAWSDSTIVLAWLNSHPNRWKTFVANRVSEILNSLDSAQWFHVSTKDNPADCASRGVQPSTLSENCLWFNGPSFLKEKEIKYKKIKNNIVHEEEVNIKAHVVSKINTENYILHRFSSLPRMLRVIAYCRRFYKKNSNRSIYITKTEIDQALLCCIRMVQKEEFPEDYINLQTKGYIQSRDSKLKSLCPYLDECRIMRVRGRLQKSLLDEDAKHPIILPHNSHLSKLIVANAHHKTLHGGNQLTINYIRSAYWIIGVKSLVKQNINRCVICVRQKAKIQNQYMGSLPSVRCTPARAFLHSGVDYAGPIKIRTTKGRGNHSYKGYICLFVCMATRAIHLEVVSDMSTQAFLAAFRRFVSRRGHCAQLWSDNGTTFVGASKELQKLAQLQKDIAQNLETHGTEWHFIPPHAPNFGGLWEAGVKSTKFHLKRVIGETTLTFEEMSTFLCQVEACLNSRPMTVDNSDPDHPLPLTPGHFLIGGPLITAPDFNNYESSNISSLTRWQFIQKMLQGFWRRWSDEYLSSLITRYKWRSMVPEPNEGDVVLVKEDDLPPTRWLMGRIEQKHKGSDNVTRVVSIRVKSSVIKRPTSKICILPIVL